MLVCALLSAPAWARPGALPPGPPAEASLSYTVRPGDTVIGVSRLLLVDPADWRRVAAHNRLRDADAVRPGQVLQFPVSLLQTQPLPAQVTAVQGEVRALSGQVLTAGAAVAEGARLRTGAGGGVSLRLVDGTVLQLRGNSELTLSGSRRYPGLDQNRSAVELHEGRVEVRTPPSRGGAPGFEVRTPRGVMGVRGTEFRVGVERAAERSLGEVLEGRVSVAGADTEQLVGAGFGTVVDRDGRVAVPVALLPPPSLQALPALQERVLARFEWPALAGAAGYRAQVSPYPDAGLLLVDDTLPTPLLRVAVLPDGEYLLRVRAVDPRGLEGVGAEHRFRLKARPEPPLLQQPRPGARVVGQVDFNWAHNPEAARYRLQVVRVDAGGPGATGATGAAGSAGSADRTEPVLDEAGIAATAWQAASLPAGRYRWRVASIRADGDSGPWGDAAEFEVRALPAAAPAPKAEVDDLGVNLAWTLPPQGRVDLQVARDSGFAAPLLSQPLGAGVGEFRFEPPGSGRFHVRLRFVEADGLVGPWGGVQSFDVPPCLRSSDRRCVRAAGQPVLVRP